MHHVKLGDVLKFIKCLNPLYILNARRLQERRASAAVAAFAFGFEAHAAHSVSPARPPSASVRPSGCVVAAAVSVILEGTFER